VTVLALSATRGLVAQQPSSPAQGPWSGQAQCVVVSKSAEYLDEQTHTWRLTGAAPASMPVGSAQVYYSWPATWTVQGSGRKAFPSRVPGVPTRDDQVERWTIASEMNATLRVTEIAGQTARIRIGAEGQRGAPQGSVRVTEVSGRTRDGAVQPWQFPAIEDSATNTTLSGTSTRTFPEGFGVGPGQPPNAVTTATCTWSFIRGGGEQSSASTSTGGRGVRERTPIAGVVLATPSPAAPASGPHPITTTPGGAAASPAPGMPAAAATAEGRPSSGPVDGQVADATAITVLGAPIVECTLGDSHKVALLPVVVTPNSVQFSWARPFHGNVSFSTFAPNPFGPFVWVNYVIRRDDRSEPIATFDARLGLGAQMIYEPSPVTYVHSTALEPGRVYRYTITSYHSHRDAQPRASTIEDGCASREVVVTGPP
jgi:hypothetical protein